MARPTKAASDRRTIMIRLRVTLAEKQQLEESAAGLNLSDFIRLKAIGSRPLLRKPHPDREMLIRFLAAYGKIGSNLNQLARHCNRKQGTDEFDIPISMIAMAVAEVREVTRQLREILHHGYQRAE